MTGCIRVIAYISDGFRLDELKRVLAELLMRNSGCRLGVYLCIKGLNEARVLSELNEVFANNSTNTILFYEFDDWEKAVKYAREFGDECEEIQLSPAHH